MLVTIAWGDTNVTLWNDLAAGWRYARGLAPYMRDTPIPADPVAAIRAQLASRESAFLDTVRGGIFAQADSPYRVLLQYAGATEQDIAALVRGAGIEATLRQLYDAGVYVTLDEFKGRVPITRPGLELPVTSSSFDNPLSKGHLRGVTGGSRTKGTRVLLSLDDLTGEFAGSLLWLQANRALGLPQAYWRPAAPSTAALKWVLIWARLGTSVVRWYTQTHPGPLEPGGLSGLIVHATTWGLTALAGHPAPYPRYLPTDAAEPMVRWLATETRRGVRIYIDAIVSSAVRLCIVARELGLDISGHLFRTVAEPLTPAKAQVLYDAGCDVISAYGLVDAGRIGSSCGTPNALDDMHLLTTRTGFLQVPKELAGWPQPVGAIHLTTLRPTAPKLLLNVETGDYGVMSERQCGCTLGEAGLTTHLHTIRNYEKLTSAGMHFMGADLLELLEVVLPQRYGGHPTDYQFVEAEESAQTVLKLVVSPSVGTLDAAEVKGFVLRELERRTAGGRLMTDIWRDSDTLQIERAQPYTTGSAKIQPLHVMANRMRASS
jgi:hypothetical protein